MSNAATILGADAVTGEPAVLQSVATHLSTVSANVDTLRDQLRNQSTDGWSGDAADAFRSALDEIPGELDKLTRSYDEAATTVSDYASKLQELRSKSDALAGQIAAAQQRLTAELAAKRSAKQEVTGAAQAHASAADPVAHSSTGAALDAARSSLSNAETSVTTTNVEIAALRKQAHENRADFDAAVKSCCSGLDAASDLGIRNSLGSWYDRHIAHGGAVGKFFDSVVVAPFRDTVNALKAFIDNPSLKNLSTLLGAVGGVLALVGCVLLVAALGFGTGGMVFAAGGLLLAGSRGATIAKLGVDDQRLKAGEPGAASDLVGDGVSLVVPGKVAGKLVPLARTGAPTKLVGASEQLARQESKYAASPSPANLGWVTRRFNDVTPLVARKGVEFGTGALIDQAPNQPWGTAPVNVGSCPAPWPLFSPSTTLRYPIAGP